MIQVRYNLIINKEIYGNNNTQKQIKINWAIIRNKIIYINKKLNDKQMYFGCLSYLGFFSFY